MNSRRACDLARFYELLVQLERNIGGARRLSECHGRMDWPQRGVYFFREAGEERSDTGEGPRIVRTGQSTKLWGRLNFHKGTVNPPGGRHRESVFREIVGAALVTKHKYSYPTWGERNLDSMEVRESERPLERAVSVTIGAMPFLWLAVGDEPGPDSLRGYIERNAIALLSNYGREPIDPPSSGWLGHHSDRERVRLSGLWNNNHVEDDYTPAFLDTLQQMIERIGVPKPSC